MNSNIKQLLDFCERHERLICYGAGDYSHYTKKYLDLHEFHIDFFLVSNNENKVKKFEGISVCSIDQYLFSNRKYGIILSLQSMYHAGIKDKLKQMGVKYEVFPIDDHLIELIKNDLLNRQRDRQLFIKKVIDEEKIDIYKSKIQEFLKKYKAIEIKYIDMKQIGNIVSWVYYCEQKRNSDRYYLYYPITRSQVPVHELKGANAYLAKKLSYDNMEMLSSYNIEFWNFFIHLYRDFFIVYDEFNQYQFTEMFNRFACNVTLKTAKSYISFHQQEVNQGEKFLETNGINGDFICFAARDSVYKKNVLKYSTDLSDLADSYRNMDINAFEKMARSLSYINVLAIRMGALVDKKLEWPNVLDYAFDFRTEFLDLFLFSRCKFFISNPSGIQHLALLFSKPLVSVNAAVLTTCNDAALIVTPETDLAILKKYWNKKEKRYLTIKEMLSYEMEANKYHQTGPTGTFIGYHKDGIVPVDNTPEEILEVVEEMLKKLNGTVKYTEEDEKLQHRYQSIIDGNLRSGHFPFRWRIGAAFLRKNSWLLD